MFLLFSSPPAPSLYAPPGRSVGVVVLRVAWCCRMVVYGAVWWCMVVYGGVWWCMVVYGGVWGVYGGEWWFMVLSHGGA